MLFSLFSLLSSLHYFLPSVEKAAQIATIRATKDITNAYGVPCEINGKYSYICAYVRYVSTCHERILFRRRLLFMLWHQSTILSRKFLISTPFLRWIRYYKITMLHLSSEMILLWLRTDCVEVEWEEKIN